MSKYKKKKKYEVEITEYLRRRVIIEAESEEEAEALAEEMWHDSAFILDTEDFDGVEFNAKEEERAREDLRAETR